VSGVTPDVTIRESQYLPTVEAQQLIASAVVVERLAASMGLPPIDLGHQPLAMPDEIELHFFAGNSDGIVDRRRR